MLSFERKSELVLSCPRHSVAMYEHNYNRPTGARARQRGLGGGRGVCDRPHFDECRLWPFGVILCERVGLPASISVFSKVWCFSSGSSWTRVSVAYFSAVFVFFLKILLGNSLRIFQFPRPPGIRASSPEFHHVSITTSQSQGHQGPPLL